MGVLCEIRRIGAGGGVLSLLLGFCLAQPLQAAHGIDRDLTELSLEELLEIDVRLSARKGDTLRESPAAVYVLNRDSIRRSGATSIPELLRLVPGVEVTRFGSGKWGVGIRGFNGGIFTNRLLILVDGRSVFSPAKIGMFWDTLDTLIEDIERIEVVRGPGTALWGANAFNGVINIVTRSAGDTQGALVSIGGGDEEKWFTGIRYGGELGRGKARAYIKAFERDAAAHFREGSNNDGWTSQRAGFRYDQGRADTGAFTVIAEAYHGNESEELFLPDLSAPTLGSRIPGDVSFSGASLQGRWWQQATPHSQYEVTFSADHSEREDLLFDLNVDSYELGFQHDYRPSDRQRWIWGLGARYTDDELPDHYIRFVPPSRSYTVYSGYAQYEYSLPEPALRFILGSKLEHNDFSGLEMQPNARMIWSPTEKQRVWVAVSEANRTPSRTEHDSRIPFDYVPLGDGLVLQLEIQGHPGFDAETLLSHELGWRYQFSEDLRLDVALYFNEYDGLRTLEATEPVPVSNTPPQLILPVIATNGSDAKSWGGELLVDWLISDAWRTEFHYSNVQIHVDPLQSQDPNAENAEGESPQHRATLRAFWDVAADWEINANLRYVDDVNLQRIPEYTQLDLMISKRFHHGPTVSVVGQNLLDKQHREYIDRVVGTPRNEMERGAYLKVTWQF